MAHYEINYLSGDTEYITAANVRSIIRQDDEQVTG